MLRLWWDKLRSRALASSLVYLLIVWVAIAWVVFKLEKGQEGANIQSFWDGIWWGIVTFLTVGYGDRYPITPSGRLWAMLLMVSGAVTMSILTAKISSYFLEKVLEGKLSVDPKKLNDHIIICGWKEEMHEILFNILNFNPGLKTEQIVVIANLKADIVESLCSHPKLQGMHVLVGNYFEEVNLRRAAPERARKVVILGDRTPLPNGQMASVVEVDSRTVMTAMTLSHIARGTSVVAEVMDKKMDQYLKMASVSDILYVREYSRFLLGNASGGTGVSNIIFDLLDPSTPTMITTQSIPEAFHGKKFDEYKKELESHAHTATVLIGILENTGNMHTIKEAALKQAQKTPDVQKLVENLKNVKQLRCNNPIFNPPKDYLIPDGSLAIVVITREHREKSA